MENCFKETGIENISAGAAPAGYIAVKSGLWCKGCALAGDTFRCASAPPCAPSTAGVYIIFVEDVSTAKPATLLHPMGSMGEEVVA